MHDLKSHTRHLLDQQHGTLLTHIVKDIQPLSSSLITAPKRLHRVRRVAALQLRNVVESFGIDRTRRRVTRTRISCLGGHGNSRVVSELPVSRQQACGHCGSAPLPSITVLLFC